MKIPRFTFPSISEPAARGRQRGWQLAGVGVMSCLALAMILPRPAGADIYRFVDKNGVVHLADRPGGPGWRLYLKTRKRGQSSARANYRAFGVNREKYAPMIDDIALRYRLDRALVQAVVRAESSYDPNAISAKGAVGLMQLMPGTAAHYGVNDRYNPAQNVTGGVRYLRDLLVRFKDVTLALAAYNAGADAVLRYGHKVPPFKETRTYVRRVLLYYREIRQSS